MALYYQIMSGVIGHAIGDALGVPVEFSSRERLTDRPVTDMRSGGTHGMPAGTWSDDTSMEIALMQSLIDKGAFDYADIMQKFREWLLNDEFTATGESFDVGSTCARAIENFHKGITPTECGGQSVNSNGNGSLMRILPIAYICYAKQMPIERKYQLVRDISSLTHAHEISVLGCYIYVNYVCHLLDGDSPMEAYEKTRYDDYSMFSTEALGAYNRILTDIITTISKDEISGSGYVVNTLEASLWCLLTTKSYDDAVLEAVNLGEDTDTTGAVTGSLAGIVYGYDNIPEHWRQQLRRHDYLLKLCKGFEETITQL